MASSSVAAVKPRSALPQTTTTITPSAVTSENTEKDKLKFPNTPAPPSASRTDPSIADLFDNLEYGPAPESADTAYAWLDEHRRKFGYFVNNKWHHPEGRKYYESTAPATKVSWKLSLLSILRFFTEGSAR